MNANPLPGILSQELVVQYAAKWLEIVESTDATALQQCFAPTRGGNGGDAGHKLLGISYPLQQIVRLVSTIGATHVKASFVVLPGADGAQHFSVVLAASNDLGARISSYYLAEDYQARTDETGAEDQPTALVLGATPGVLARTWRQLWRRAPAVTPDLFASSYGYLRGYTFTISDFVATLASVQNDEAGSLVLHFGLHEYYRPDPAAGDALVQTFGLILQLRDANKDQRDVNGGSDPYYDMSYPCPPSC